MPATQIMSLSPSLTPSLAPFLSIEVILCIFTKTNSLAFAPKYPSVSVHSSEQPLCATACGTITQGTECMIAIYTKREKVEKLTGTAGLADQTDR